MRKIFALLNRFCYRFSLNCLNSRDINLYAILLQSFYFYAVVQNKLKNYNSFFHHPNIYEL